MANRFFIPRRSLADRALPIANTLLRFKELSQRGELARGKADVAREANQLAKRRADIELGTPKSPGVPATPGTIQQGLDIEKRQIALKENEAQAKWEADMVGPPKLARLGVIAKAIPEFQPAVNEVKEGVNNGTIKSRWDAYRHLKSGSAIRTKQASDKLLKRIVKLTDERKTSEASELSKLYDGMQRPTFLEEFFQFPKSMMGDPAELDISTQRGAAIKSWLTPEGEVVNIPNNQTPPPGSTPLKSGLDVEVGPDGSVSLRTGVTRGGAAGPSGLQKKTIGDIEKKQFNTSEQLARVNSLWDGYQEEFLQVGPRLSAMGTEFKEKFKGTRIGDAIDTVFGKASPEDKQFLQDYTAWATRAVNNANLYIKEITGAQMSNQEAGRIMKGVVDADGLILFDSNTKFLGKMESIDKALRMTLARTQHYLTNGFTTDEIKQMSEGEGIRGHRVKIADMQKIINAEGKTLMAGGATKEEAQAALTEKYPSVFQVR